MPTHFVSVVLASAVLAVQVATPPPMPPAAPPAGTAKPVAQSTAARPGSLALTVVSQQGQGLLGAGVVVHGLVERAGSTGADGVLVLQAMPPGTYRCRIVRDGFITLEKEVVIRAGARTTTEGVLSAAPTPPPPPPAPVEPRPPTPTGPVGAPKILSIPDMAEQMLRELKDTQPVVERQMGCSVSTSSRLIVAREAIALHRHADVDEMVYLVAGEATLAVADRDQSIVAGWFGFVPRGTSHSLIRRGRNPIVVLSVQSGAPCSAS